MNLARILMPFLLALSLQIAHSADTAVPSTLRIGTSASYPPLTFKADGKLQGVESDLGTTVEKNLKVKAQFVELAGDELIPALNDGRIDIFIHDAPTIWRLTANTATEKAGLMGLYRPLTEEYLAWAVRNKDKALADALNDSLDTLKKDGALGRIMGRWIPIQVRVN